jgi:membrane dipeptidase
MARQLDRVSAYQLELSDAQRRRVESLLAESTVVSAHDHLFVLPEDVTETPGYMSSGRVHTGYAGLIASPLDAVIDNLSGPLSTITSPSGWTWTDVIHDLGMRLADLAHQSEVLVARSVSDIEAAHESSRKSIVFGLESATPIESELNRLDVLYGLGIRQIGIVYSHSNCLGTGLAEGNDGGLTSFGHKAVRRMNALGIAIDVSHASDQTCLDVFNASAQPVMISHAGARAVWPTSRMKPDDVLRACAMSGGILGIEAAPHSTVSPAHPKHSLDSVMDHFVYAVDVMGIDHVAFGPDTMWGDHVALHSMYGMSSAEPPGVPGYERVPYVSGIENPTEAFPNIVAWLVGHEYSDEEIRKVIGGNVLRILREAWR